MAVQFISRPHTPALAFFCPREEWCVLSARAIATVIRSCRNNMERSRRSLRRQCSTPRGLHARVHAQQMTEKEMGTLGIDAFVVVVVFVVVVSDAYESVYVHSTSTLLQRQAD